jgi:formylglycine-generating enzyme required for sulfatase activity
MRAESFAVIAAALLVGGCSRGSADSGGSAPVEVVTKSGIAMVYIPAGQFTMGAGQGAADALPAHSVTINAFLMDKVEVTQDMFAKLQLSNPSQWQDPKRPVERVRWLEAKEYLNERSRVEGLTPYYNEKTPDWQPDPSANGYRLPTEAEWEYAARAGVDGPFDFGSADKLRQYAWVGENSNQQTHAVGEKRPNRWGLFDMYGNVSEWTEDVYSDTVVKASSTAGPIGGENLKRVVKGGNFKSSADLAKATFRIGQQTGNTDACFSSDVGFRAVRTVTPEDVAALRK